jgi:hypothetical protein
MSAESTGFRLSPAVRAATPFLEARTWGAVAYVWLSFPLGLAWFVGLVVGFATGFPLTILWVGFLVLIATLVGAWGAQGLERRLAMLLLGARVPERRERPAPSVPARFGLTWLRSVLGSRALWKGLLFLALRFPLGLVGWVASVVSLSLSAALLAAPFVLATGLGRVDLVVWQPDSALGALPIGLIGFVLFVATLHLHRAFGWAWARLAELLLGGAPAPADPPAPRPAGRPDDRSRDLPDDRPLSVVPAAV